MTDVAEGWRLGKSYESGSGRIVYEVFGSGQPIVLVHGTPSSSYLWRGVVERLSPHWEVYVYDLLGYGASEKREGQDVSIAAQTDLLVVLLGHWGLEAPRIAGHDIGAAILLRAHLLRGVSYQRMALADAVSITPWITPFSRHVKHYMEAFSTMPEYVHRQAVAAHLRSAIAREMIGAELWPYINPWSGAEGQAAYYRHVSQLDERYTDEIEPLYGSISIPTLVLWGEQDGWLDPSIGQRLHEKIPSSRLQTIPGTGHFATEDAPVVVAAALEEFFGDEC